MGTRFAALAAGMTAIAPAAFAGGGGAPAGGIMGQLLFFVPLILIFYFLLIRPQQQRAKKHTAMVEAVKRGDTVVTSGGLVGKVTKAADKEITVELADNVRVQVIKSMIVEVRGKNEPVAAND